MLLRTFGTPALIDSEHGRALPLRQKDLALLIYLRVEPAREHSRTSLAALLWSEHDERRARHSVSQAVGRIRELLGTETLTVTRETVLWRGTLDCDAALLQNGAAGGTDPELGFYAGDFVAGFSLGPGASTFDSWADGRRAAFRRKAVQILDARGEEAERLGNVGESLQLGQRLLEVEPLFEAAHRRVMRAWSALGERGLALRQYKLLQRMTDAELGIQPDPATRELASGIAREIGFGGPLAGQRVKTAVSGPPSPVPD